MSTSGVYTLGLTFNEIATEALDLLQVGADGESLSGPMTQRAQRSANLLLKAWQGQGIHLWTYTEATLFLAVGQYSYDLTNSHVSNTWYETTTTADTTANAMSFQVLNAANIQASDIIGIIDSTNDLFWTTVSRVSGLTVYVNDQITNTTSSGTYVRNYRDTFKPVSRVLDFRRQDSSNEIPMSSYSRADYYNLPNKTQTGSPIIAYYDRQDVSGEGSGIIKVWNAPDSSVPYINFTGERKLQIFDDPDETVDLPDWAQLAFIYNLAVELIPKFGCSPQRAAWIKTEAITKLEDMLSFDAELAPIKMKMRQRG